jgi:hypothetical protein
MKARRMVKESDKYGSTLHLPIHGLLTYKHRHAPSSKQARPKYV